MNIYTEILEIAAKLQKKKSHKDMRIATFIELLQQVEVEHAPERIPDVAVFLREIKTARAKEHPTPTKKLRFFSKRWIFVPVCASMGALFIMAGPRYYPLFFQQQPINGHVIAVQGRAFIVKDNVNIPLKSGDSIASNSAIVTGKNSLLDLKFASNVEVRLLQTSGLNLKKIITKSSTYDFLLTSGKVLLHVSKQQKDGLIAVSTPYATALVKGTFFSAQTNSSGTMYKVFDGKIKVTHRLSIAANHSNQTKSDYITQGQAVVIGKNDYCVVKHYSITDRLQVKKMYDDGDPELRDALDYAKSLNARGAIKKIIDLIDPRLIEKIDTTNAFMDWKRNMRSNYLLYNQGVGYLLSVNQQGTIDATNLDKLVWQRHIGVIQATPVIYRGILYIASAGNKLSAIQISSGKLLWAKHFPFLKENVHMYVRDNRLLIAFFDKQTATSWLYNMTHTGHYNWKISFQGAMSASPLISNNIIFIPLHDTLIGVDGKTGLKIIKTHCNGIIRTITPYNNSLYLTTDKGIFYSYNIIKGENNWEINLKGKIRRSLFDKNAIFLVKEGGEVYKLTYNGAILWRINLIGVIKSRPMQDSTSIYINTHQTMYVIDKNQGQVKWSVVTSPILSKNIALSQDKIFFVSEDKGLIILKK